MSQTSLRKQLRQFCAHEITPIDLIIGHNSPSEVLQAANSNLRSARSAGIMNTLGFIRDAALHSHPLKDSFRRELAKSTIWCQLRELLYHKHSVVRSNTIYTIGKLTFRPKAKLLVEAFPHYLKTDPINLSGLMFELRWLTGKWHWTLLNQIATAPHFIQRWSLCSGTYDQMHSPSDRARFEALFQKLSKDSTPVLAAEAVFRCESSREKSGMSERSYHGAQDASPCDPKLNFDFVANRFLLARQTYTFSQFERFACQYLTQ
jgi:hypothetical protein